MVLGARQFTSWPWPASSGRSTYPLAFLQIDCDSVASCRVRAALVAEMPKSLGTASRLEKQITAGEARLISALAHCLIPAGTADRRFVDVVSAAVAADGGFKLTSGQRAYIGRLAYRYRHQLPPELVETLTGRRSDSDETSSPAGPAILEDEVPS